MTLYDRIDWMRNIMLKSLFIIIVLAATAVSCNGAPEFELAGREMFEGPPRDAGFFHWGPVITDAKGMILSGGSAIMVIPVGTPLNEGITIQLDGEPLDIETIVSTAWVAVKGIGLVAVDLSDLTSPRSRMAWSIQDIRSCEALGRYLIVNSDKSGLFLFDLKNIPFDEAPLLLSHLPDTAPGAHLYNWANLVAAVSGREVTLLKLNTRPAELKVLSRIEAPAEITKTGMSRGVVLHLLSDDGELYRYDLEDPLSPVQIPSLPEKNISDFCIGRESAMALLKSGKIVPFPALHSRNGAENEVHPDPQYSLMIGEGITSSPSFPGSSIRYVRDGFITFGQGTGFNFYEFDGKYTKAAGNIPMKGFAIELTVSGKYIYLANGRDGLRIGRIDQEGSVEWTGHVQTEEARDVAIEDDILVLVDGKGGARFYRLTVPDSPSLISTWESLSYLSAVKVRAGRAYFAGGLRGVEVVDFTDPAAPSLVWSEKLSEVRGVEVDDDHLYVADGFEGFRIYSLAGSVPKLVSIMDTPGWVSDLFVSGDILYIADGQRGFMTVDISDRNGPAKLGRIEIGAIARTLHVRGNTAFIATQILGITAIDVSDPRKPLVTARYRTVDDARGVFSDGTFVYLASGSGGLYIFRY